MRNPQETRIPMAKRRRTSYRRLVMSFIGALIIPWPATEARQQRDAPSEYVRPYEQLMDLHIDRTKAAVVSGLVLQRDVGIFTLHRGQLFACSPVAERTVAVLFIGEGTFSAKPPTQIERDQLFRFFEQDSINMKFENLFMLFADTTWEELQRKVLFRPGAVDGADKQIKACLKYLSDEESMAFHTDLMYSFLQRETNGLFYSHFTDEDSDPYFFEINPFEEEEVSFSKRGESSFDYTREAVTQFHTREEYQARTAGSEEDKELVRASDYNIDVHINDDLEFSATAVATFRPAAASMTTFPFQIYHKLIVDSISFGASGRVAHFQGNESPIVWVFIPRPLVRNESCTLTVRYHGDLLEKNDLGWIGLESSSRWYPRWGARLRANFDLTFHTPADWQFASVGKKQSAVTVGDTLVSRWKTVRPTHNVSFSIGPFKEVLLEDEGADRTPGESLPNVTVLEFRYAPGGYGLSDLGEDVRADMLNCLRFFQHVYGKSPVEDLFATEIPYLHGEAFPGLIQLSWDTFKVADPHGRNQVFRAHEIAHQWWGVGVNFRTYHDQWLSEAFSEYSGLWYMQMVVKDNEKFFDALDLMKERILGNRKYLFSSGQESGPIWLGYRTHSSNTEGDYNLIVYQKGAWVVHMLRNMMVDLQTMNEDRFVNMMREFYTTYLGREASTRDFQRIVEKHMGFSMDWFFRQWIMETKIPRYSFAYRTSKTQEGKFRTTLRVRQEDVPKEFAMPIPLLIKFDEDRFVRLRIVVSGEKQEYELPLLPLEPVEIIFNDLSSVLCEVDEESWR